MKIAHISDLHLSKITLSPSQFFSKRWLGNINLIFFRKKTFKTTQLYLLPKIFKKENVDYIMVSGDLSSTSLKEEFESGKEFFESINIKTLFVPGNHDHYTKKAHTEKRFYEYFTNKKGKTEIEKKFSLKEDGVEAIHLKRNWWYIGLDTALATHLISSKGLFSKKIEKNLKTLLKIIPSNDFIIIVNHFPFSRIEAPRRTLKRCTFLEKIIKKHKNIKFFMHGHTHRHSIEDLREKNLPIILDSGSASHNSIGRWNLLEIEKNRCNINVFHFSKKKKIWEKGKKEVFYL
jgi:3',5'-cyclic AMP phosphodiesterase CpdA